MNRHLPFRHGTNRGYDHRGCRCDPCRRAHAERIADVRARAKLLPDDPRHGTRNGYDNYGCRCSQCLAAKAWSRVEYYARAARP